MKKIYFNSMVALAAFCLGGMNANAENLVGTAPVKMTYIDYNQADVALGQLDTIRAGYNKDAAVGSAIGFGNTGWGENKVGVLKVDVSSIPGTVQKATLKAKISGSSDSKRTTGWGIAQTDNAWSADLTYATAGSWTVSKKLNGGTQVWSEYKPSTYYSDAAWDITEALSGGEQTATLLVYETAAAGGYLTGAFVEVEYEQFEATTTKFDFEGEDKVFTDDSRITGAIETDATLNSKVLGWTCAGNAQNGYSFSHYDFTSLLNQPALVAVEFDYYNTNGGRAIFNVGDAVVRGNTGGSSKVTYNKTGVIFQIGSDKNNFFINGQTLPLADVETPTTVVNEEGEEVAGEPIVTPGFANKWLHVAMIANIDAKTVAWTVTDQEGNVLNEGNGAFFADDAVNCSQVDLFGYINNSHCAMIDNLSITNYKSTAQFAEYSVRYVDAEGNEIKDARTATAQVGKFVALIDADKAAFKNADNTKKYIYDSDDSETVAIAAEGTVITVKFREAETLYAVLNCVIEGTTTQLMQYRDNDVHHFFEGDNYYIYPPRGIEKDGAYYFCDATSWNGITFPFPGSLSARTVSGKKTYIGQLGYTKVDSVAYYSDIERLALPVEDAGQGTGLGQLVGTVNSWYSFSGGIFDRFSGGRGIRLDVDSYVYTEPIAEDGTYKVTMYGRNDVQANQKNPYALGVREADGSVSYFTELTIPDWASATTGTNIVEGVAIKAGQQLVVKNTGALTDDDKANQISLDDISLTKTGDYVAPVLDAINEVKAATAADGAVYTLSGVQVSGALKPGLYIQNGKVFVVK